MKKFLIIIITLLSSQTLFSQLFEDLYIYGTAQTIFLNENIDQEYFQKTLRAGGIVGERIEEQSREFSLDRNTFMLQQFNLFLNKFYGDKFNFFVDLQLTQNYNSENGWGSFSVQEAWMNYRFNEALQIKAGQLFPAFNNLNEIKNRLNLLNYLFRPIVYEGILSDIISSEDFIPERAFLQFHGQIPINRFYFDWALYMGNGESSFLVSSKDEPNLDDEVDGYLTGSDPNGLDKKLYGGRIGLRSKNENFKFGLSGTRDYNEGDSYFNVLRLKRFRDYPDLQIEDQMRLRYGADLSFTWRNLSFESEYSHSIMEDIVFLNENQASFYNSFENWNDFMYATLSYDFLEDYFAYLGYSFIKIGILDFESDSDYITFGAGWRINSWMTLKGQYIIYNQEVNFPVLWDFPDGTQAQRLQGMNLTNNMAIFGFSAHF